MSLWDKYKIGELPEEQRADVIKEQVKQHEETQRAKINSGNHQTVRGMAVVFGAIVLFCFGLFGYFSMQEWKEVKVKDLTIHAPQPPFVCPAATCPPVTCPPTPFDIHVSPAAPTASAAPSK